MKTVFVFIISCFTMVCFSQNHQLAQNYFEKGDFEKAQLSYEQLLQSQPSNLLYLTRLIDCYQQLQQYDKAIDLLKDKVDKSNQFEYLVDIGYTYQKQNNTKKAEKYYQEAVRKVEQIPGLVYAIAKSFEKKTLLDWALLSYQTAIDKNPNLNFNFQIALVYGEKGDFDQMIERLILEAFETPYQRPQIQHYLAQYLEGDTDGIFKEKLRKALLLQAQKNQDVFWNQFLSWYYIQNKEFAKAFRQQKAVVKREPQLFSEVVDLVYLAIDEDEKEAVQEIAAFILEQTIGDGLRLSLQHHLLKYELETLTSADYVAFRDKLANLIATYPNTNEIIEVQILAAHFDAFYLNQPDNGIALLQPLLSQPIDLIAKSKVKMELADIHTYKEEFNRALIYYSQIEMDLKNNPLAHEASFRIAKTSYYKNDFDWALKQVKVLKSSSSQLIANDALEVFLLITDNNQQDSTYTALKAFAKADFKLYQKKTKEALAGFEQMLIDFSQDPILEPTYIRLGDIYTQLLDYPKAISNYEMVLHKFPEGVYLDEALFFAAELYSKLENQPKAKFYYEKIILEHPDSIYFNKAQQKFRILRGDKDF